MLDWEGSGSGGMRVAQVGSDGGRQVGSEGRTDQVRSGQSCQVGATGVDLTVDQVRAGQVSLFTVPS